MTKLTGLDLYILTDTLLHSLAFHKHLENIQKMKTSYLSGR
jgi:hypothetical protein